MFSNSEALLSPGNLCDIYLSLRCARQGTPWCSSNPKEAPIPERAAGLKSSALGKIRAGIEGSSQVPWGTALAPHPGLSRDPGTG